MLRNYLHTFKRVWEKFIADWKPKHQAKDQSDSFWKPGFFDFANWVFKNVHCPNCLTSEKQGSVCDECSYVIK